MSTLKRLITTFAKTQNHSTTNMDERRNCRIIISPSDLLKKMLTSSKKMRRKPEDNE
jgi:hypothetical protein